MNFHIAREGQQIGVFSDHDVRAKLRSGELRESDLGWSEGMTDWLPLRDVLLPPSDDVNPYAPPAVDVSKLPEGSLAPLASLGQRFAAAMLDTVMAFVCVLPIALGVATMESDSGSLTGAASIPVAAGGVALLVLTIYNLVLLTRQGQTLGKKWVAIRIVNIGDQSNPGFVRAVLLRAMLNNLLIGSVPEIGLAYAVADICFIFREDRRCVHDLIAGTQVVQERAQISSSPS